MLHASSARAAATQAILDYAHKQGERADPHHKRRHTVRGHIGRSHLGDGTRRRGPPALVDHTIAVAVDVEGRAVRLRGARLDEGALAYGDAREGPLVRELAVCAHIADRVVHRALAGAVHVNLEVAALLDADDLHLVRRIGFVTPVCLGRLRGRAVAHRRQGDRPEARGKRLVAYRAQDLAVAHHRDIDGAGDANEGVPRTRKLLGYLREEFLDVARRRLEVIVVGRKPLHQALGRGELGASQVVEEANRVQVT